MKKSLLTIALLFFTASICGAADIQVVTEEWKPYNFTENGKVTGISTEVVKITLEKAGLTYKIDVLPWARALKKARNEANVLIYTIVRNKAREKQFKWIGPLFSTSSNDGDSTMSLYRLKDRKDIVCKDLKAAAKYKVGVVRGNDLSSFTKAGFKEGKQLFPVAEEVTNIRKLFKGRIDLISGSANYLQGHFDKIKDPGISFDNIEPVCPINASSASNSETIVCMAFGKSTPDDMVEKVRAAFEAISAEGKIQPVLDKYADK
ncbi:MAG: transporter substrate-binding domain-containing protein [Deltaproteobacteria bacterium]|nr:transporter substrate-binding domain-containing protein [Deltaproteobacteria bacterium]